MVTDTIEDTALMRRVRAEFDDLPGMCLTFQQVARLMGFDDRTCAQVLHALLMAGYLRQRDGAYVRADRCQV
jgi:hypothetical protein